MCETWIARVVRVSPVLHGHDFWRREGGRLVATPLFVALVVIETTDIVFALDSIPAVLAVTRNPFIVYSSNVMAMLGLRSLYFVLADALPRLRYLRHGMAVLLVFTATKMLASAWIHISPGASVLVIGDRAARDDCGVARRGSAVDPRLNVIGPLARAELDDAHVGEPALAERIFAHDRFDVLAALARRDNDSTIARDFSP